MKKPVNYRWSYICEYCGDKYAVMPEPNCHTCHDYNFRPVKMYSYYEPTKEELEPTPQDLTEALKSYVDRFSDDDLDQYEDEEPTEEELEDMPYDGTGD